MVNITDACYTDLQNKDKKEIDFIKTVYKKKIQSEIESYKDTEDEDKIDTIQVQDVLMLDIISI